MLATDFIKDLKKFSSKRPNDITFLMGFFKTAPGEYGAGDEFIGARVPQVRAVCKRYNGLSLDQLEKLLESSIHEVRLGAVIIMDWQAKHSKGDLAKQKSLFELYLKRTDRINNWDIVDSSCRSVVGNYLLDKDRSILYKLAKSKSLWERRIAIISTGAFINVGDLKDVFAISELLLGDRQDLIHKAVGWMLRESGKKDKAKLLTFLDEHAGHMPRTMLRYATEHFSPKERAHYMGLKYA